MAKVVFVGDPRDDNSGPKVLVMKGVSFPKGEEVEVTNEALIAKLKTNDHFEVDGVRELPPGEEEAAVEEKEVVHTVDECTAILNDRKIRHNRKAPLADLVALVEANGGFPPDDSE